MPTHSRRQQQNTTTTNCTVHLFIIHRQEAPIDRAMSACSNASPLLLLVNVGVLLVGLLLLSNETLEGVRAQTASPTCTVALGDISDFGSSFGFPGYTALVPYVAPATQTINSLSVYLPTHYYGATDTYAIGLHSSYDTSGAPNFNSIYPLAGQSCITTTDGSGNGDPLFTGFLGQQFYIAGVHGQVMNILSTYNMQLNARLVQLVEGQSITPYEQDKLREWSETQHKGDSTTMPSPYPRTIAWTHDGTYFSDAGVALLDTSRLYVKAGGYAEGWAVVTLNGRPLPVSDQSVVLN